jgi:glyoxylase-like metal-dependent hydrolase (beta-lactamase superfamily II)
MPPEQEKLTRGEGAIDPYKIWPKDKFEPISDGETFSADGCTLKALFTPGHANDHMAFLLEEVSGLKSAVIRPASRL